MRLTDLRPHSTSTTQWSAFAVPSDRIEAAGPVKGYLQDCVPRSLCSIILDYLFVDPLLGQSLTSGNGPTGSIFLIDGYL